MNVLPPKPENKSGVDWRLAVLCLAVVGGSFAWPYLKGDKITKAEAEMLRLEQLIKDESAAMHEDKEMLTRLNDERKTRLEAIIAGEAKHIEAWQAAWRDLEVSIREWKAEQRIKEAKP
jgi:hypothetical protein